MHWMQQSTSTSTLTVKAPQMIQQYNRQGIEVLAYRGSSIAYKVTIDIVYVSEIHFLDGIWYIILYT